MNSDFIAKKLGLQRNAKAKNWRKYKYRQLDNQQNANEEEFSLQDLPFRRSKCPKETSAHYLEHTIKEGDSLQKLSILYDCPVAELKRANRLLNSQEFFARKKIKIPVKSFSILTEILPSAESDNCTKSTEQVRTIHLGISQVLNGEEQSEAAAFLKRMDEDLIRIRESTKTYKDSLEEAAATLTSPQFKPIVNERKSLYHTILQWRTLGILLIVFLVFPILGVIYIQFENAVPIGNHSIISTTDQQYNHSVSILNNSNFTS